MPTGWPPVSLRVASGWPRGGRTWRLQIADGKWLTPAFQGSRFRVQGSRFAVFELGCWMLGVRCSSRSSKADYGRFVEIATGSVFEVVSQATISLNYQLSTINSCEPHHLPDLIQQLEFRIGSDQVPAPDHWPWKPATLSLTLPLRLHRFSTYANGVVRPVNSMFLP